MPFKLDSLSNLDTLGFDDIIDVRSPAEYADDHLPGAISLPVLSDDERARIGTIYKQESPFTARKSGAALVSRNIAAHLEGPLADRPGGWRPLVYCWRGGQRSGAMATVLRQIGWPAETLDGGYRSYRRLVVAALYDAPFPAPVIVLDGNTGSAKTELLNLLPAHGVQIIDLEGLARHRGSLFGAMGRQPAQRGFETALAMAALRLDPARPVLVEAESSKIGECRIPPALWTAMRAAPRIEIRAPLDERAAYLARTYHEIAADPARLHATLDALRRYHPAALIEEWHALAEAGATAELAGALMSAHYDPAYLRHRARRGRTAETVVDAPSLAAEALPALAARLADALSLG